MPFLPVLSAISCSTHSPNAPIAGEMRRLMADPGYIDKVLINGAERASAIAEKTMTGVKDVLGFVRRP